MHHDARGRRSWRVLFVLACAAMAACGPEPPTTPSPPAPPLPPSPPFVQHRVSGTVTDATSAVPIVNATVVFRHALGSLEAQTDSQGAFAFSFETNQRYRTPTGGAPEALGLLVARNSRFWGSIESGHWTTVQLIPWGVTDLAWPVRLRPVRELIAGQSLQVSLEPDSSLLWDQEWDPWFLVSYGTVLEEFLVSAPSDGTLTIDARPEDGGTAATLQCRYVGCPSWEVQGSFSLPVQANRPYYFAVEGPRNGTPRRFVVTTSLR